RGLARGAGGHLGDRFSLAQAARSVGASERTLARRLQAVLGKTPLGYVQDLRVERAMHRLHTSQDSVDAIAAEVGYGDGVTLRALLRRKTGRGGRELRGREARATAAGPGAGGGRAPPRRRAPAP